MGKKSFESISIGGKMPPSVIRRTPSRESKAPELGAKVEGSGAGQSNGVPRKIATETTETTETTEDLLPPIAKPKPKRKKSN